MSDLSAFSLDTPHPDRDVEQAHLDHAYVCLAAMRRRSQHIHDGEFPGVVYADGMIAHEDEWNRTTKRRLADLETAGTALCFGRIDRDGERWYVGRRHVEDDDAVTVVADWRAPVSVPFYRATVADPMGLELRRRLIVEDRQVVDLFDEHLDDPDHAPGAYVPDPLLAELGRRRTGEMRDIVATIQAEQDVVIRAPIEGCIIVQGGPGTGKTAVGLHRAAYLLYEHADRLRDEGGLLVVGPNKVFLRYIEQVLPSLGETATTQWTVEQMAGRSYFARATEPFEIAALKGDARMAALIRASLASPGAGKDPVVVPTQFGTARLDPEVVNELVATAESSPRPRTSSRDVLRHQLTDLAWKQYLDRPGSDVGNQAAFEAQFRTSKDFKRQLDRVWPTPSAGAAVARLLSNRRVLDRAGDGILDRAERDLLHRKAHPQLSREPWTPADLVLIDEARSLVDGVPHRFGHVVVDEAQDLSAMALRMIARAAASGSLTVLGDLAQATAPGAVHDWDLALEALATPGHIEELDVGYRVPAPVLDFANRLLPAIDPTLRPARSVRDIGEPPTVVSTGEGSIPTAVASRAALALAVWHSVAVISPEPMVDEILASLSGSGLDPVDARRSDALGDRLTVLTSPLAKGLEFDAVLVVEPAALVAERPKGLHALYIDLTRAVQSVEIIHARPLPGPLGPA